METTKAQDRARLALSGMLAVTGVGHLTFVREDFKAQVPDWIPLHKETVVALSGVAELLLAGALLAAPKGLVGRVAAGFFTAIFPGNVSQYTQGRSAFGLDTDGKRLARLFGQPVLVGWALWSTGVIGGKKGGE